MVKLITLILSFSIVFTSVAPSALQAQELAQNQRSRVTLSGQSQEDALQKSLLKAVQSGQDNRPTSLIYRDVGVSNQQQPTWPLSLEDSLYQNNHYDTVQKAKAVREELLGAAGKKASAQDDGYGDFLAAYREELKEDYQKQLQTLRLQYSNAAQEVNRLYVAGKTQAVLKDRWAEVSEDLHKNLHQQVEKLADSADIYAAQQEAYLENLRESYENIIAEVTNPQVLAAVTAEYNRLSSKQAFESQWNQTGKAAWIDATYAENEKNLQAEFEKDYIAGLENWQTASRQDSKEWLTEAEADLKRQYEQANQEVAARKLWNSGWKEKWNKQKQQNEEEAYQAARKRIVDLGREIMSVWKADKGSDFAYKHILPLIQEDIPLYASLGSEMIAPEVKSAAAQALRTEIENNLSSCSKKGKEQLCNERVLKSVGGLVVLGGEKQDSELLGKLLRESYKGPVGTGVVTIACSGLVALNAGSELLGALKLAAKDSEDAAADGSVMSLADWTLGVQTLRDGVENVNGGGLYSRGYEYSFYKQEGTEALGNSWTDLGQELGELSKNGTEQERRTAQHVLAGIAADTLRASARSRNNPGGLSILFQPFWVGALAGGYELNTSTLARVGQEMDANGRVKQVDTRAAWKDLSDVASQSKTDLTGLTASILYRNGMVDTDAYTARGAKNLLVPVINAHVQGSALKTRNATASEIRAAENRAAWRKAMSFTDVGLLVLFTIISFGPGAVRGVRGISKTMRAVRHMAGSRRLSKTLPLYRRMIRLGRVARTGKASLAGATWEGFKIRARGVNQGLGLRSAAMEQVQWQTQQRITDQALSRAMGHMGERIAARQMTMQRELPAVRQAVLQATTDMEQAKAAQLKQLKLQGTQRAYSYSSAAKAEGVYPLYKGPAYGGTPPKRFVKEFLRYESDGRAIDHYAAVGGRTSEAVGASVKKPSLMRATWETVKDYLAAKIYDRKQFGQGIGWMAKTRKGFIELLLSAWLTVGAPAASFVESTAMVRDTRAAIELVESANALRTANQIQKVTQVATRGAEVARLTQGAVRATQASRAGEVLQTARAAVQTVNTGSIRQGGVLGLLERAGSTLFFVPAVATPENMRGFGTRIFSNRSEPGSAVTRWMDSKIAQPATGILAYQYGTGKAPSQQGFQAPQLIQQIGRTYNIELGNYLHAIEGAEVNKDIDFTAFGGVAGYLRAAQAQATARANMVFVNGEINQAGLHAWSKTLPITSGVAAMNGLGDWVDRNNFRREARQAVEQAAEEAEVVYNALPVSEQTVEQKQTLLREALADKLAKTTSLTDTEKATIQNSFDALLAQSGQEIVMQAPTVTISRKERKSFGGLRSFVPQYQAVDVNGQQLFLEETYGFIDADQHYTDQHQLVTEKANLLAEHVLNSSLPTHEQLTWIMASAADAKYKLQSYFKNRALGYAAITAEKVADAFNGVADQSVVQLQALDEDEQGVLNTLKSSVEATTTDNMTLTAANTRLLTGNVIDKESLFEVSEQAIEQSLYGKGITSLLNVDSSTDVNGNITYTNYLPVHLRYQNGETSAEPKLFVALNKKGFTVPVGHKVVLDETGMWKYATMDLTSIERKTPIVKKILGKLGIGKAETNAVKMMRASSSERHIPLQLKYVKRADLMALSRQLINNPGAIAIVQMAGADKFEALIQTIAYVAGADMGASLSSQLKSTLSGFSSSIIMSGFGYASPFIANWFKPLISKYGTYRTLQVGLWSIVGVTLLGMASGMYGFFKMPSSFWGFIPVFTFLATAIIVASIFSTIIPPVLKNAYPDSTVFASQNLEFTTKKGLSRLLVQILTLGLKAGSAALFAAPFIASTPVLSGLAGKQLDWSALVPIVGSLAGLSLYLLQHSRLKTESDLDKKKESNLNQFVQKERFQTVFKPLLRAPAVRTALIYLTYAPLTSVLIGTASGQLFKGVGLFGLNPNLLDLSLVITLTGSTLNFAARKVFNKLLKSRSITDDQLTGMLLPVMAVGAVAMAALPLVKGSSAALLTAVVISWFTMQVATSTFGVAENSRMQNEVARYYDAQRRAVREDPSLSAQERETQLKSLKDQEEDMKLRAAQTYNKSNGMGLLTILLMAGSAAIFTDWLGFSILPVLRLTSIPSALIAAYLVFSNSGMVLDGISWIFNHHRRLTSDVIDRNDNKEILQALGMNRIREATDKEVLSSTAAAIVKETKGYANSRTTEIKIARLLNEAVKLNNRVKAYIQNIPQGADKLSQVVMNLRVISYNLRVLRDGNGILDEVDRIEGNDISAGLSEELDAFFASVNGIELASDETINHFLSEMDLLLANRRLNASTRHVVLKVRDYVQNMDADNFQRAFESLKPSLRKRPELVELGEQVKTLLKTSLGPVKAVELYYLPEKVDKEFVKTDNYEQALAYEREMHHLLDTYNKGGEYDGILDDFTRAYTTAQAALDKYLADNQYTEQDDARVTRFRQRLDNLYDSLREQVAYWQETNKKAAAAQASRTASAKGTANDGNALSVVGPASALAVSIASFTKTLKDVASRIAKRPKGPVYAVVGPVSASFLLAGKLISQTYRNHKLGQFISSINDKIAADMDAIATDMSTMSAEDAQYYYANTWLEYAQDALAENPALASELNNEFLAQLQSVIEKMFDKNTATQQEVVQWLQTVSGVKRMNSYERDSAVWKLTGADEKSAVLKISTQEEIDRIALIDSLVEQLAPQLPLLHIEVPRVLKVFDSELNGLPESVRKKVQADLEASEEAAQYSDDGEGIRDAAHRLKVPFLMTTVDTSGLVNILDGVTPNRDRLLSALGAEALSAEEWSQVRSLYDLLHQAGFQHGETHRNLYFKRDEVGKLQVTMLDFEAPEQGSSKDDSVLNEWEYVFGTFLGFRPEVLTPLVSSPVETENAEQAAAAEVAEPLEEEVEADAATYQTGTDAVAKYLPNWREELGAKLSSEQLDIVAEALAITDGIVFAEGNKTDWNYRQIFEQRFAGIAKEKGVEFNKAATNAVVGQKSYFGKLFLLESVYGSLYALGRYPQGYQKQTNLTPEQLKERALYSGVRHAIGRGDRADPVIAELTQIRQDNLLIAKAKTAVQWLAELQAFMAKYGRYPRLYDGQTNLTPEQLEERALYVGVRTAIQNGDPSDPVIAELTQIQQANKLVRTPAEVLAELKAFMQKYGRYPLQYWGEKNLTDEQKEERSLHVSVQNAIHNGNRQDPIIAELTQIQQANKLVRTPAEVLAELKAFIQKYGRYPREYRNQTNLTPEQLKERALYRGVVNAIRRGDPSDPVIAELTQIQQDNLLIAKAKTAVQWLEALKAFMAKYGRYPLQYWGQTNLTPEQLEERALYVGVRTAIQNGDPSDPVIAELTQIRQDNLLIKKTPAQWLAELKAFIQKYGRYPREYRNQTNLTPEQLEERALYVGVQNAIRRGDSADSVIAELIQIRQLTRAAQRGDITWDEALGKLVVKHKRPRITSDQKAELAAKRAAEQAAYEAQLQKELDQATPAYQKSLREVVADSKELLSKFPTWLQKVYKYVITTNATVTALNAVTTQVRKWNDRLSGDEALDEEESAAFDELFAVVETIYVDEGLGQMSKDEFVRLVYVGNTPTRPQAEDFHFVSEMPVEDYMEENVDWAQTPHIRAYGEENMEGIVLSAGVTAEEIDSVINSLIPEDTYKVRMGNHELGISGNRATSNFLNGRLHIHLEETEKPEDFDTYASYTFEIDASNLVAGKNKQQIAKIYRNLFGKYLSPDVSWPR